MTAPTEKPGGSSRWNEARPFTPFQGTTIHVNKANARELEEGLLSILRAEGPTVGERLMRVYCASSGGRLRDTAKKRLSRSITSLVRKNLILEFNPSNAGRVSARTYCLPGDDPRRMRTLGGRKPTEVPLLERVEAVKRARVVSPGADRIALLRLAVRFMGGQPLSGDRPEAFGEALDWLESQR